MLQKSPRNRPEGFKVFKLKIHRHFSTLDKKLHSCGQVKRELFEKAGVKTVMCACARMLYHALKRFWVRGSVSVWTESFLIHFRYRISVDGEHFMHFQIYPD